MLDLFNFDLGVLLSYIPQLLSFLSLFKKTKSRLGGIKYICGNFTGSVTPVPIPNTEVKSFEVDGTIVARLWESRTLPGFICKPCAARYRAFYFPRAAFCRKA